MRRRDFIAVVAVAAAGSPLSARGQQRATPVIGLLGTGTPRTPNPPLDAFRQALSETGYVEGQNLTIEQRWAEGRYDRLPAMAADLVGRKVDVIVAAGDQPARVTKNATSTIPIVFIAGGDPVRQGLVASLAQPDGNLTGFAIFISELLPKRLELLSELVPQAKVIAVLGNPDPNIPAIAIERLVKDIQEAARARGVQLHFLKASTESEIDAAFAALVERQAGALLIVSDSFYLMRRELIVALAARHAVPAIYELPEYVTEGGLISYGASIPPIFRQVGIYAGKILKGAKPAELPVVRPTAFELVINLKTAKALGLTVPPSLLARADEVIE